MYKATVFLFSPVFEYRTTSVCALRFWVIVITAYQESQSLREDMPAAVWRWASV